MPSRDAMVVPETWRALLASECRAESFAALTRFLSEERATHVVYPEASVTFRALALTPPENVKAVILGQDPYHGAGQAHGLAFSVPAGAPLPPTLKNIFKELVADLGGAAPTSGSLEAWAEQGVLLLNTVLTVRAGEANSHQRAGWEPFTDGVIRAVAALPRPIAFVLWGKPAQKKLPLVEGADHLVITSPHPSPLSAYQGFFGSRPFSKINAFLREKGLAPINWSADRR